MYGRWCMLFGLSCVAWSTLQLCTLPSPQSHFMTRHVGLVVGCVSDTLCIGDEVGCSSLQLKPRIGVTVFAAFLVKGPGILTCLLADTKSLCVLAWPVDLVRGDAATLWTSNAHDVIQSEALTYCDTSWRPRYSVLQAKVAQMRSCAYAVRVDALGLLCTCFDE